MLNYMCLAVNGGDVEQTIKIYQNYISKEYGTKFSHTKLQLLSKYYNQIPKQFIREIVREFYEFDVHWFISGIYEDLTWELAQLLDHYTEYSYVFDSEKILVYILNKQKYKESDGTDIIKKVIEQNKSQFEEAKTNPKLIGWFVGQIIKQEQGKLNAGSIRQQLEKMIKE